MGSPESVLVIAHWQSAEAARDEVLDRVAVLRRQTLAEPGCLGYQVFQNASGPDSVVIVERYRDAEAQRAHADSPHYREHVVEFILPRLTARRVEILRVRELT